MTLSIAREMVAAEILKLRRNRALMAFALLLSVGVVVLFFGFTAIEHASNPQQYGPAGGMDGFNHAVRDLGVFFGVLTAILIGAEAGTADIAAGVFRDLVATGRSRRSLFFVRVPAAILVSLAFTMTAFLVSIGATFLFAGGTPTPSLVLILQALAWIALSNAIVASFAVGIGTLTGSRALTLTAVIGWQTIATQILLNTSALGSVRDGLLTPALTHLSPIDAGVNLTMATGVAIAVLTAWVIVPLAVGVWRAQTQDA
jgi:ABC-type transport system involved in multi-copper enzyme maturation permease subunit